MNRQQIEAMEAEWKALAPLVLREVFAAIALLQLVKHNWSAEDTARGAYQLADAMLKERSWKTK